MRILELSWEYPPYIVGGMGQHVTGLIRNLGGRQTAFGQLQVEVITTRYANGPALEQAGDNLTVHRIDLPPLDTNNHYNHVIACNDALIEFAAEQIRREPFHIIHIHDWLVGAAGIALKNQFKLPLAVTIHATERGRQQGYPVTAASQQIDDLERRICHEAWKVVVCSAYMASELSAYFGTPADKIVVIPNGIDIDGLTVATETEVADLRRRYAPNGERLLFYVGRIVHEKGVHVLINAMPAILAEFPNARLLVAGKNGRSLAPLVHALGVEHAVQFLGFIPNRQRDLLYQTVDAAVFPSIYEPFGIVALEAMALGCNVIASDVGGLGEVVRHMRNGLTVFPDNAESIAWAVHELFTNPAAAAQRRKTGCAEVTERYSWPGIAQQTAQLFETIALERLVTNW